MFSKKLLVSTAFLFVSATVILVAQNNAVQSSGTTVWGKNAKMTIVTESAPSVMKRTLNDSGLITIFSSLAAVYPKGLYWCCSAYNVMGPTVGEQWMAAPFTPTANHTLTRIEVAVGFSQGKTNGVVISLYSDNHGVPGKALKTWNASNLPRLGTCCGLVVKTDSSGIPVTTGTQYWVVLSTNSNELDTVDGWNFADSNQVDAATLAVYPGSKNRWTAFQATPGLGFAVKGTN